MTRHSQTNLANSLDTSAFHLDSVDPLSRGLPLACVSTVPCPARKIRVYASNGIVTECSRVVLKCVTHRHSNSGSYGGTRGLPRTLWHATSARVVYSNTDRVMMQRSILSTIYVKYNPQWIFSRRLLPFFQRLVVRNVSISSWL